MATSEHRAATWRALDAEPPERVYEELVARYREPHRHHHTRRHLAERFAALSEVQTEVERLGEVELALWLHDAVYDTRRHDNEQRSADWTNEVAVRAGLGAAVGERVTALVMATRHAAVPPPRRSAPRWRRARHHPTGTLVVRAERARFDRCRSASAVCGTRATASATAAS